MRRAVGALLRKDLRLELRTRESVPAMVLFSLGTFVLFHFALNRDDVDGDLAAGILWVTLLFAAVLGINRLFVAEREEGGFDGFLLAPVDRTALFVAKAVLLFAFLALVEVAVVAAFAILLLGPSPWGYLGGAIAGSSGTPSLAGSGDLVGGQSVTLTLTAAKALTPVTLIIGLSTLNAPFKGGMLVPNPILLIFGLPTNAHGTLMLSSTWPSGLPSGFTFYTQYWIPDSAGPAGLAASNGLSGKTP